MSSNNEQSLEIKKSLASQLSPSLSNPAYMHTNIFARSLKHLHAQVQSLLSCLYRCTHILPHMHTHNICAYMNKRCLTHNAFMYSCMCILVYIRIHVTSILHELKHKHLSSYAHTFMLSYNCSICLHHRNRSKSFKCSN